MKHPNRIDDYIQHIIEAADKILEYKKSVTDVDAFRKNQMVHDAIIRNLMIIGEAANKIRKADPIFETTYPDLPWNAMKGMRNVMVHDYENINLGIVWRTIHDNISELREQVMALAIMRQRQG